ncbi:hypothetical protein [Nocardia asiatica]
MTRHLHYTEALREAEERGEIIVALGDMVVGGGKYAIVAWPGSKPEDATLVMLVPPVGYGYETGIMFSGLRYMGWIDDLTTEEIDSLTDDEFETVPECGHSYGLDASTWRIWDHPYWEWFRGVA